MPLYDVHAYALVRIKVSGVEADNQLAAIDKVERELDPNVHVDREIGVDVAGVGHVAYAEYADEITQFMVDEAGDNEFERSTWYELREGQWQPGKGEPNGR